jgi:hypothetical protein
MDIKEVIHAVSQPYMAAPDAVTTIIDECSAIMREQERYCCHDPRCCYCGGTGYGLAKPDAYFTAERIKKLCIKLKGM